jgi:hypothetical protein
MEIIFFQVGETEEKTDKEGNVYSTLTSVAEKITIKVAEGIDRTLPRKQKVEVWSSIATHVSETAEIIAEELGVKRKFVKSIGGKSLQELINVITEYAKDRCLVIIGEHDFIVECVRYSTGLELPLENYQAVCIEVSLSEFSAGRLLWTAHPGILKRLR